MNYLRLALLFLFFYAPLCSAADRSFNIINYRSGQGFAAINGYCIYQTKNGYLWIGTENGLFRFNGYDFKTYTTRDGLPDNEIFGLSEDTKGRLWMLPFANSICYLQHGKVYNRQNDSLLKKLQFSSRPEQLLVDWSGAVLVWDKSNLTLIGNDKSIKIISAIEGYALKNTVCQTWIGPSGQFMVACNDRIYAWAGDHFNPILRMPFTMNSIGSNAFFDSSMLYLPMRGKLYRNIQHNGIAAIQEQNTPVLDFATFVKVKVSEDDYMVTSEKGPFLLNSSTGKITDQFLSGIKTGAFVKAQDGAYWFGTIGKGIFRFQKTPVKSIPLQESGQSIIYIKGNKEGADATTDKAIYIGLQRDPLSRGFTEKNAIIDRERRNSNYLYLARDPRGGWIGGAHSIFWREKLGAKPVKQMINSHIKAVLEEGKNTLLVAALDGVFRCDPEQFRIKDTLLYNRRATSLEKINDVVYAGTLEGLLAFTPDKQQHVVLPNNSLLQRHITTLSKGAGDILWVANNNAELVALKDEKLLTVIDLKQGLQCRRISCMKGSGKFLWVGTDNGVFAISQSPPYTIIKHLTAAAGLNSNQVNCLDIFENRVWAGTINGINYFDESEVFKEQQNPAIIINSIINGDSIMDTTDDIITLLDQPLAIDFDVVNFSGGTRPVFQYKMGNQKSWITLENNQLYFPVLPYGSFTLTLRTNAPNWPKGAVFSQRFYNPPPFYQQWWVILIFFITGTTVIGVLIFLFIRKIRNNYQQKLARQQSLLLLEQMALQGQLNPHFIFNCMASIKQYNAAGDTEKANNFVDALSLLMRQTFELGSEVFISLDQELNYLVHYLNIEQERFNHSFRYHLEQQTTLPITQIPIPAMLLQPAVENAIRHGIRHLPDGQGAIFIRVKQQEGQVTITISDNGIGRQKSKSFKSAAHNSTLTSTTVNEKRINILNRIFEGKITLKTEDILNSKNETGGTRVIISYPVSISKISKDESYHY